MRTQSRGRALSFARVSRLPRSRGGAAYTVCSSECRPNELRGAAAVAAGGVLCRTGACVVRTQVRIPSPCVPDIRIIIAHALFFLSSLARYEIQVRQQPRAARACGFGERDRRVIDPPPIVQLVLRDPAPGNGSDAAELRYPFNVVHCTLWNEDGTVDETAISGQERRVNRRLMGTLVASPFVALDENEQEGCFFCFPDLSCRTHGRYRLKFVLMRIDMENLRPGGFMPVIISTMSDVFTVFTAKEFPGMRPSTPLTRALKRQGCAIPVKKGNERAGASARAREEEDDPSL